MKTILISGSTSGIGRAITETLLQQGHKIIGLGRNHHKFTPTTENYICYSIDFAKIATLETQLQMIQKQHAVDVLICCAGYGDFRELEQFSVADMQKILHVNFLSQAILVKTFLPSFKTKQNGKIILLGSECALAGKKKGTLYCAAKFALRGFAESLRQECATKSIPVTLINPGLVDTPFFDNLSFQPGRDPANAIEPQQVANLVSTIVAEKHNYVCEEINLQPMKKTIINKGKRDL